MPTNPTTDPVPAGRVIAQVEGEGRDASGQYVKGVNVTAALDATGTTFTVFVPQSQFTPANVQAAVEDRARQVAAVHGITFGS